MLNFNFHGTLSKANRGLAIMSFKRIIGKHLTGLFMILAVIAKLQKIQFLLRLMHLTLKKHASAVDRENIQKIKSKCNARSMSCSMPGKWMVILPLSVAEG